MLVRSTLHSATRLGNSRQPAAGTCPHTDTSFIQLTDTLLVTPCLLSSCN
jgi:hypothetical protein